MFLVTMSRDSRSSGRTPRSRAPRVWPLAVTSAWRSSVRRTALTSGHLPELGQQLGRGLQHAAARR